MNWTKSIIAASLTASTLCLAGQAAGQAAPAQSAAADRGYRTEYAPLGMQNAESLLFLPTTDKVSRVGLVYAHPNGNTFQESIGGGMARRGFVIAMVNVRTAPGESAEPYAPAISKAIQAMRARPGIERVVLIGHSGGGHLAAFYQNVAENGPLACSGPEKIYPCRKELVTGLEKPDGLVLLDPTLGAFHQASSIDPAVLPRGRDKATDMFDAANGFDAAKREALYSPQFAARFHAAQARRSNQVTAAALARLQAINAGKGAFNDDEPWLVRGMGVTSAGARLYQPDRRLLSHTRGSYTFYKTDGTVAVQPIVSARPVLGEFSAEARGSLAQMAQNTTVRRYLSASSIRLASNYAIGEDDITGVDWRSAYTATPGNAEGITAPTLVLVMGCHYLVVPGEIIYNHLAARDKTLAGIEGASHLFKACRPEFGRTMERTFDVVAEWTRKAGRF